MDVCFFCRIENPEILERNEFYTVDLQILRELGHHVLISTTPFSIPKADLYVVWWWTWAFFPLLRARLANKPVIVLGTFDHVLDTNTLEMYPNRPWWHRLLIRSVLKHADANVVVSRDQEKYLHNHFSVKNLQYCPHVIDTDLYQPGMAQRERFFVTICWMDGGNAYRKCVAESIRAVARLHHDYPEYRLVICGEKGTSYPKLAELVNSLDASDYIEFRGVVSKEEKIDLLQRCAVYLQPTRGEGFGVAILEAMACGAPVVTSPVGAVPEVGGDAVAMVDGSNPEAIAQTVAGLLRNTTDRDNLGLVARKRALKEFSYDRRKNDLEQIINQVTVARDQRAA